MSSNEQLAETHLPPIAQRSLPYVLISAALVFIVFCYQLDSISQTTQRLQKEAWSEYSLELEQRVQVVSGLQAHYQDSPEMTDAEQLRATLKILCELPEALSKFQTRCSSELLIVGFACLNQEVRHDLCNVKLEKTQIDALSLRLNSWLQSFPHPTKLKTVSSIELQSCLKQIRNQHLSLPFLNVQKVKPTDEDSDLEYDPDQATADKEIPLAQNDYCWNDQISAIANHLFHALTKPHERTPSREQMKCSTYVTRYSKNAELILFHKIKIGQALSAAASVSDAIDYFSELIRKYPDCPEYYNRRAEQYVQQHKPAKAVSDLTKVLADAKAAEETKFEAALRLGTIYLEKQQFAEAAYFASQATKLKCSNSELLKECHKLNLALGLVAFAFNNAAKVYGYSADHLEYCLIGEIESSLFAYDRALDYFQKSIAVEKKYPRAFLGRAFCYEQQLQYEQAEKDYQQVLKWSQRSEPWVQQHASLGLIRIATLKLNREASNDPLSSLIAPGFNQSQLNQIRNLNSRLESLSLIDARERLVLSARLYIYTKQYSQALKSLETVPNGAKQTTKPLPKQPYYDYAPDFGAVTQVRRIQELSCEQHCLLAFCYLKLKKLKQAQLQLKRASTILAGCPQIKFIEALILGAQAKDSSQVIAVAKRQLNLLENQFNSRLQPTQLGFVVSEARERLRHFQLLQIQDHALLAKRSANRFIFYAPWCNEAYLLAAQVAHKQGSSRDRALDLVTQVIRDGQVEASAYLLRGIIRTEDWLAKSDLSQKERLQLELAKSDLNTVLQLKPTIPDRSQSLLYLAKIALKNSETAQTISLLSQASLLLKQFQFNARTLGIELELIALTQKVLSDEKTVAEFRLLDQELGKRKELALIRKASLLAEASRKHDLRGRTHRALTTINRAIELDKRNAKYYFFRGLLRTKLSQFDLTTRDWAEALSLDKNYLHRIYFNLKFYHYRTYISAMYQAINSGANLQTSRNLKLLHALSYFTLMENRRSYDNSDEIDQKVLKDLRETLKEQPKNQVARALLAGVLIHRGNDKDRIRKELTKCLEQDSTWEVPHYLFIWYIVKTRVSVALPIAKDVLEEIFEHLKYCNRQQIETIQSEFQLRGLTKNLEYRSWYAKQREKWARQNP